MIGNIGKLCLCCAIPMNRDKLCFHDTCKSITTYYNLQMPEYLIYFESALLIFSYAIIIFLD